MMFLPEMYQLLDFGGGRKLERFGDRVLDRPSPPADRIPRQQEAEVWAQADSRYKRCGGDGGQWSATSRLSEPWTIEHGGVTFELRQTPFGHVGLFAEQTGNWDWIGDVVRRKNQRLKVLNLFAYTGGSTLIAATAGAEVVHVDAAATTVGWARHNGQLSGLSEAPIRWITEDAVRFVRRELKRGNRYDAVILDPPSYGHGPSRGQRWQANEHLPELVAMCGKLMSERRVFFLLSGHTVDFDSARMAELIAGALSVRPAEIQQGAMSITSTDGRRLRSGVFARWEK